MAMSTGLINRLKWQNAILVNGLPYREVPCLFTEKVNWPKKIAAFLKRKFRPTY